ncbi:MAG: hypothetical protein QNJ51_25750 [Calothrix sp. MO_167.B12]|nr:hypothetical protein [Calothrix sp. MO_167.B12]
MSEQEENFSVDWEYYLDWHIICKAQSLLERCKTTIKFSRARDEETTNELKSSMERVYQTLELLYPQESKQRKRD